MKFLLHKIIPSVLVISLICSGFIFQSSAKNDIKYGDVNKDGYVNSTDALQMLNIAVGREKADAETLKIGDVDENGVVNSSDALLVIKKCVGTSIPATLIQISQSNTITDVGSTIKVSVTKYLPLIIDSSDFRWESSDTSVATVDSDGTVNAISAGTAVISVSSTGGASAQFNLTVGSKASSISLSTYDLSLPQGKRDKLVATVYPSTAYNKSVRWESYDESVAEVWSDGTVWAKKIGSTTVKCTTTDGTNISAYCTVTVKQLWVPYVSQLPKYPTGCEAASCCMLLQYYGFNINIDQMVNLIPRQNLYWYNGKQYGPDIHEKFVGDPRCYYTSSTPGYGVFAPAVTKALQKAINERGGGYRAVNITGCSFEELLTHLTYAQPAIVWATYKMQNPTSVNAWYIESTGEYFSYPRGTHVMILSGYSSDQVVTVDPYDNGVLKFSIGTFKSRWELLGCQAIVIEKVN